jgi:hypothetical protein
MITNHTYKTEYTNETSEVVMLANGHEILAVGEAEIKQVSQAIAQKYPWWNDDLGSTPWSLIEYVKPGETVQHTWHAMHTWTSPEEAAELKKTLDDWFSGLQPDQE